MLATHMDTAGRLAFESRPKRLKLEAARHYDASGVGHKSLELQGVIDVLKEYDDYDGGINCSICGKLYKSKVCFIKHLWEHSVYWDLFDGEKNHDRVLSIQAAIILYNGYHGNSSESQVLSHLLVTSPNSHEKRKEKDIVAEEPKIKIRPDKKQISPFKRKKFTDET